MSPTADLVAWPTTNQALDEAHRRKHARAGSCRGFLARIDRAAYMGLCRAGNEE